MTCKLSAPDTMTPADCYSYSVYLDSRDRTTIDRSSVVDDARSVWFFAQLKAYTYL